MEVPIISLYIMSFSYLITLKSEKNHYTSLVGTYTGALMKGNAFRMHSFSKDLFKM